MPCLKYLAILSGLVPAARALDLPAMIHLEGPPGPYTREQWRRDWPGCTFEGGIAQRRVEIAKHDDHSWLRVHFEPGQIGPEQGGAGWRFPIGRHETAELSYTLQFSPGFEFVKGGKLPGLCGGPDNVSGGRRANGENGFSARLMWRRDGRGEAYVYHKNQAGDYGDRFTFPAAFRFPVGQPIHVRLRVTMNQPGQRNGSLQVWITLQGQPEQRLVQRDDLEWRSKDSFGVDSVYFETFHGGSDRSWAPQKPCWAEFAAFGLQP